jgi:hypothetical protein
MQLYTFTGDGFSAMMAIDPIEFGMLTTFKFNPANPIRVFRVSSDEFHVGVAKYNAYRRLCEMLSVVTSCDTSTMIPFDTIHEVALEVNGIQLNKFMKWLGFIPNPSVMKFLDYDVCDDRPSKPINDDILEYYALTRWTVLSFNRWCAKHDSSASDSTDLIAQYIKTCSTYMGGYFEHACLHGHLNALQWMSCKSLAFSTDDSACIRNAAINGHIDTLRWLFKHNVSIADEEIIYSHPYDSCITLPELFRQVNDSSLSPAIKESVIQILTENAPKSGCE